MSDFVLESTPYKRIGGTEYYSIIQVARMLDKHPNTIRAYIRSGELLAHRAGPSTRSAWLIPAYEVRRVMAGEFMTQ